MKPVKNTIVNNEIVAGSKWRTHEGGSLSISMGDIIVKRLVKNQVHYTYEYSADAKFDTDMTNFLKYAQRIA